MVRGPKQWKYAGHLYLSGEVESRRLDASVLVLPSLQLEDQGMWDPQDHYWGDEGEPVDEWSKSIIARGPRRAFEMEQVLAGTDPDDPFVDPIGESNDFRDAGDDKGAQNGAVSGRSSLPGRSCSPRQLRFRGLTKCGDPSLHGRSMHWGTVARRRLRRTTAVG